MSTRNRRANWCESPKSDHRFPFSFRASQPLNSRTGRPLEHPVLANLLYAIRMVVAQNFRRKLAFLLK